VSFRRFFLVRLAWATLGIWLAVTLAFGAAIGRAPPRVRIICGGERASNSCIDPRFEDYDDVHSVPERYRHFLSRLVRDGSAGVSRLGGQDTGRLARAALPVTASVVALALLLAMGTAVLLASLRGRSARLLGYLSAGSFAAFLFGLWVSYLFGAKLGRAPPSGYCDVFHAHSDCGGVFDWLSHLIVPAALLAIFPAAVYARLLREGRSLLRKSDETAQAVRRLGLPLLRVAGRDFGFLIGAAVFVESAFSLPGLGQMVATGTTGFDRLALETTLVYAAVLAIAVHFLVDVIVAAFDPDLRAGWPFADMPSPVRVSAVPVPPRPDERFPLRPAIKRRRLFGTGGP